MANRGRLDIWDLIKGHMGKYLLRSYQAMNHKKGLMIMTHERKLCIRVVPMPADLNTNGDVFGGWVLSQMDVAGSIAAKAVTKGRHATVAVNSMKFLKPIHAGDVVSIYGQVERVGNSSVSVRLETVTQRDHHGEEILVTEGIFVYVAINDEGQPRAVAG